MEVGLGVFEARLRVLEAVPGVLEARLSVLEAGLGVLEAGLVILARIKIEFKLRRSLKASKHYFCIKISMIFVFRKHTELLAGRRELLTRHTDLFRGNTTWRLVVRT